jgi:hypothetical protein
LDDIDINFMSAVQGPDRQGWQMIVLNNGIMMDKHTGSHESNLAMNEYFSYHVRDLVVRDEVEIDAYDFWTIDDLTEHVVKYGPLTKGFLKTKETAKTTAVMEKIAMIPYPTKARPVMTKMIYKDHNTITGRLMSVKQLRRVVPTTEYVLGKMASAYFHDEVNSLSNKFIQDKVNFNSKLTIYWISQHHRAKQVYDDLSKFLNMGTLETAINDINIHLKLESLLKSKVIRTFIEQQPRSIMWQAYFVSAIFSPIFLEIKRRLKLCLHSKIIYADGMTPKELGDDIRFKTPSKYFFENDLEKQDRQTDEPLTHVELSMYYALGCHEDVLQLWQTVHEIWRFKSNYSWGFCKSMRLTGQATTAIGNAIINLQTNCEFISDNLDILDFLLVLGDDNSGGFSMKPDISNLKVNIATRYNMMSEPTLSDTQAAFCCFLITNLNNKNEMVPDIKRMRHRFEVTNGVSEATPDNLQLRALSYLMMVKPNDDVHDLDLKYKNLNYERWFDPVTAIKATAEHYNVSVSEVEDDYSMLISNLSNLKPIVYSWEAWKATKV